MFRIYQDSTPSCACSQNCGGRWVRRAVVIADTFFLYCKEGQNPLQKEKSAQESRGEMEITTQTAVWRPSSFRTRQHCLFVYNMAGAEEKEGEDQTERQTEGGEGNTMEGGEDAQYETTKEQMVPFEGCEEAFWKAKDPKFILQAEDEADCDAWLRAISRAREIALEISVNPDCEAAWRKNRRVENKRRSQLLSATQSLNPQMRLSVGSFSAAQMIFSDDGEGEGEESVAATEAEIERVKEVLSDVVIFREGTLLKRGNAGLQRWVERAVVVVDASLRYGKDASVMKEELAFLESEARGKMDVTDSTAVFCPEEFKGRENVFLVYNAGDPAEAESPSETGFDRALDPKFIFQARDGEDRESWVKAIGESKLLVVAAAQDATHPLHARKLVLWSPHLETLVHFQKSSSRLNSENASNVGGGSHGASAASGAPSLQFPLEVPSGTSLTGAYANPPTSGSLSSSGDSWVQLGDSGSIPQEQGKASRSSQETPGSAVSVLPEGVSSSASAAPQVPIEGGSGQAAMRTSVEGVEVVPNPPSAFVSPVAEVAEEGKSQGRDERAEDEDEDDEGQRGADLTVNAEGTCAADSAREVGGDATGSPGEMVASAAVDKSAPIPPETPARSGSMSSSGESWLQVDESESMENAALETPPQVPEEAHEGPTDPAPESASTAPKSPADNQPHSTGLPSPCPPVGALAPADSLSLSRTSSTDAMKNPRSQARAEERAERLPSDVKGDTESAGAAGVVRGVDRESESQTEEEAAADPQSVQISTEKSASALVPGAYPNPGAGGSLSSSGLSWVELEESDQAEGVTETAGAIPTESANQSACLAPESATDSQRLEAEVPLPSSSSSGTAEESDSPFPSASADGLQKKPANEEADEEGGEIELSGGEGVASVGKDAEGTGVTGVVKDFWGEIQSPKKETAEAAPESPKISPETPPAASLAGAPADPHPSGSLSSSGQSWVELGDSGPMSQKHLEASPRSTEKESALPSVAGTGHDQNPPHEPSANYQSNTAELASLSAPVHAPVAPASSPSPSPFPSGDNAKSLLSGDESRKREHVFPPELSVAPGLDTATVTGVRDASGAETKGGLESGRPTGETPAAPQNQTPTGTALAGLHANPQLSGSLASSGESWVQLEENESTSQEQGEALQSMTEKTGAVAVPAPAPSSESAFVSALPLAASKSPADAHECHTPSSAPTAAKAPTVSASDLTSPSSADGVKKTMSQEGGERTGQASQFESERAAGPAEEGKAQCTSEISRAVPSLAYAHANPQVSGSLASSGESWVQLEESGSTPDGTHDVSVSPTENVGVVPDLVASVSVESPPLPASESPAVPPEGHANFASSLEGAVGAAASRSPSPSAEAAKETLCPKENGERGDGPMSEADSGLMDQKSEEGQEIHPQKNLQEHTSLSDPDDAMATSRSGEAFSKLEMKNSSGTKDSREKREVGDGRLMASEVGAEEDKLHRTKICDTVADDEAQKPSETVKPTDSHPHSATQSPLTGVPLAPADSAVGPQGSTRVGETFSPLLPDPEPPAPPLTEPRPEAADSTPTPLAAVPPPQDVGASSLRSSESDPQVNSQKQQNSEKKPQAPPTTAKATAKAKAKAKHSVPTKMKSGPSKQSSTLSMGERSVKDKVPLHSSGLQKDYASPLALSSTEAAEKPTHPGPQSPQPKALSSRSPLRSATVKAGPKGATKVTTTKTPSGTPVPMSSVAPLRSATAKFGPRGSTTNPKPAAHKESVLSEAPPLTKPAMTKAKTGTLTAPVGTARRRSSAATAEALKSSTVSAQTPRAEPPSSVQKAHSKSDHQSQDLSQTGPKNSMSPIRSATAIAGPKGASKETKTVENKEPAETPVPRNSMSPIRSATAKAGPKGAPKETKTVENKEPAETPVPRNSMSPIRSATAKGKNRNSAAQTKRLSKSLALSLASAASKGTKAKVEVEGIRAPIPIFYARRRSSIGISVPMLDRSLGRSKRSSAGPTGIENANQKTPLAKSAASNVSEDFSASADLRRKKKSSLKQRQRKSHLSQSLKAKTTAAWGSSSLQHQPAGEEAEGGSSAVQGAQKAKGDQSLSQMDGKNPRLSVSGLSASKENNQNGHHRDHTGEEGAHKGKPPTEPVEKEKCSPEKCEEHSPSLKFPPAPESRAWALPTLQDSDEEVEPENPTNTQDGDERKGLPAGASEENQADKSPQIHQTAPQPQLEIPVEQSATIGMEVLELGEKASVQSRPLPQGTHHSSVHPQPASADSHRNALSNGPSGPTVPVNFPSTHAVHPCVNAPPSQQRKQIQTPMSGLPIPSPRLAPPTRAVPAASPATTPVPYYTKQTPAQVHVAGAQTPRPHYQVLAAAAAGVHTPRPAGRRQQAVVPSPQLKVWTPRAFPHSYHTPLGQPFEFPPPLMSVKVAAASRRVYAPPLRPQNAFPFPVPVPLSLLPPQQQQQKQQPNALPLLPSQQHQQQQTHGPPPVPSLQPPHAETLLTPPVSPRPRAHSDQLPPVTLTTLSPGLDTGRRTVSRPAPAPGHAQTQNRMSPTVPSPRSPRVLMHLTPQSPATGKTFVMTSPRQVTASTYRVGGADHEKGVASPLMLPGSPRLPPPPRSVTVVRKPTGMPSLYEGHPSEATPRPASTIHVPPLRGHSSSPSRQVPFVFSQRTQPSEETPTSSAACCALLC
uniref:PH domain-containing protein n=1 Tax=Chromera velia CCMP2878 TaxID=1169474 RepID=A0A0K6S7T1_9ALVE|eukprot:Cvel_23055.t1-p1 / transcript=Cvel_23055.t1 / gene=Cvel_23055 / organism=Chromera_velia_CCMP2878 / gene_product=hypothetical protein / transcript_product=hypothetical protein / location=Cvel_scaffold2333:10462-21981(+) / protein_length=2659 / sequence_SO=supercontig / SO=protein_coding / is_pseudo=false